MTTNAQDWLDSLKSKYNNKEEITEISVKTDEDDDNDETTVELSGELKIEDFSELKKIYLNETSELDKLIINNCPKLTEIHAQNSGVKEIELGKGLEQLLFLDFSLEADENPTNNERKLKKLDLSNVINLKVLVGFGIQETELTGIEELNQLHHLYSGNSIDDEKVILFPNEIFRRWKKGIKDILGVTSVSLPDDWETKLSSKLGKKNLSEIPSGQTLKTLIEHFNNSNEDELEKKSKGETEKIDELLTEINDLGLKLTPKDITKDKVCEKIKELIIKSLISFCSNCDRLKSENVRLKSKFNEKDFITKKILRKNGKEIFSKWGRFIFDEYNEKTISAPALQVEKVRNELIERQFKQLKETKHNAFYLNTILMTLSIGNLFLLTWSIIQKSSFQKTNKNIVKKNLNK
ncbi:hypothetical protein [endosymbiont GvMRE of Glomus versiforme]|uniref:hypothetical protein n=1 Tax=endosymbiont GvMRE of Glomus versiforme TaxID=2039283 RepID=UPI000ECF3408|nr:hypothetical protein [endosymbiont GvMRE of Glomus versiforme]RHZ35241.1 hypothetical protein GvMRE_IIg297 [endosymbiont GvMRE of Glomus versiforme]